MSHPLFWIGLLGVLQGLTEFLPVSSSGHLALGQLVFGLEEGGLALNVTLHAGTLLATFLVLRRRVAEAILDGARAVVRPSRFLSTPGGRDALFVILASLPTAVLGLLLRDLVEHWTHSPLAVGLGFVTTTFLLVSTWWAADGSDETPSWGMSLLIGLVQGLAVMPGLSRSGTTICVALWLGIRRERAFELSMLASLPAVAGAVLLELPDLADNPIGVGPAVLGAGIAFAVGIVALVLLRKAVVRGHFPLFALWTLPLAVATLAMAHAWPR